MNRIREARKAAGLTQKQMSEKMGIPKRTIENWEGETRKCPEWAERLIVAELKRIYENKDYGGADKERKEW